MWDSLGGLRACSEPLLIACLAFIRLKLPRPGWAHKFLHNEYHAVVVTLADLARSDQVRLLSRYSVQVAPAHRLYQPKFIPARPTTSPSSAPQPMPPSSAKVPWPDLNRLSAITPAAENATALALS
jgi:hypothetical protein